MPMKGINTGFDILMLWMLISIRIILVISWTKILLRVMDVGTLMKVSRSRSANVITKRVKTQIFYIESNVSWIR